MSTSFDHFKAKQLIKQIQEALLELNAIVSQPPTEQNIPANMKAATKDQFNQPQTQQPPQQPNPSPNPQQIRTVEQARLLFPEELDAKLSFEDKDTYIEVKPKQFLGSNYFAEVAGIVRAAKGEYISAGRDSHFRVYKTKGAMQ
jgi:hypothetical protein